jgi:predicted P-loop ATPase
MITNNHISEWVENSGVSDKITQLNVVSLDDDREIDKRLNRNVKSRWKHTKWGAGWWVSGVDPKFGIARGIGGQFKPDQSPDKDRKYFGISDSAATPLFLDTGDREYWSNAIADVMRIVIITEGAKKAGAVLTLGMPCISIPGVTTGQKLGRLKDDLLPFFQVGRRVYLCFDSDVMTKPQVQAALDRLGRLIAETGANVSVIKLPQDIKGVDDLIVKHGGYALHELINSAPTFEEWRDSLKESQSVQKPQSNRQHCLAELTKIYGKRLRLNLMTKEIELDGVAQISEHIYLDLMRAGIDASKEFVSDVFYYLATSNKYHPVQDYLQMCKLKHGSDTLKLLDKPSERYIGTEKPIYDVFVRKTLIGAVARAFKYGCKVDTSLILQGKQGKRKSTFFKTLAGEWFDDSLSNNTSDKDEKLKLHSTWIMEWAELETIFSRKDVSSVKAFLSSSVDKFRAPFTQNSQSYPRHSIICGTTNSDDFLQDSTGTRRFWVVPIPENKNINVDLLAKERDQLWAAAYAAYERGDQWWLSIDEENNSEISNEAFRRDDSWIEVIITYLENRVEVSVKDVLEEAIGVTLDRQDRIMQMRAADILRSLNWDKKHTKHGKIWARKTEIGSHGSHGSHHTDMTGLQGDYLLNRGSHLFKGSHQNSENELMTTPPSSHLEVVTTQNQTQIDIPASVTTVTHNLTKKKREFPEKIEIGDKVIIKDVTAAKKVYPRLGLNAQTAIYEVDYFNSESKLVCKSGKFIYELHLDWLWKFQEPNHES